VVPWILPSSAQKHARGDSAPFALVATELLFHHVAFLLLAATSSALADSEASRALVPYGVLAG